MVIFVWQSWGNDCLKIFLVALSGDNHVWQHWSAFSPLLASSCSKAPDMVQWQKRGGETGANTLSYKSAGHQLKHLKLGVWK
jgi:hypothetical protein